MPRAAGLHLGEQVNRMGRHPEHKLGARLVQPIEQASAAGKVVQD
jgi:hypothetical protein